MEIEESLAVSYERYRYKKEMEIISNLKDNPAIFYSYARKHAVVQSSIGPLKNVRGEMCLDRLEMSNLLSDQYYSIRQDPYIHPDDPVFNGS